jgi:hypothetical protein
MARTADALCYGRNRTKFLESMPDSFLKKVPGGVAILIEALDRDIQVKDESAVLAISAGRNNQRSCGVGIEARARGGLEAA